MQLQLTTDQICQARALRADGKSYSEIKEAIGADVAPDAIRYHCRDVVVQGKVRTRVDKGMRTDKNGRVIRPYSEVEDAAIVAWVLAPPSEDTMAALAKRLGRRRHSVAARIDTLRKLGRVPALP